MAAATELRQLVQDPNGFLFCPGVYDGFSARVALEVGFDGIYMAHMRTNAETIAELAGLPEYGSSPIPLLADADTGYGGPIMVARTVQQYARSGVAGLHIEDQVQTKRCGHLAGKEVVDRDVLFARIQAGHLARNQIKSDIVIIARTDALQTHGYDEAIARSKGAHKAGADVAFFEGLTSKEQASQIIRDLAPMPVLLNMVESGATPSFTAKEAREIGFKIMIVPFVSIVPAYSAMKAELQYLKENGTMADENKKMTPQDLFRICGVDASMEIDREAGGKTFRTGID